MVLNLVMLTANVAAIGLMWAKGERPERIASALIAITVASEVLVQDIQFGTWRVGILLANTFLLIGLWVLAEISDRWWLVLATALQLLLVLSALMPLMGLNFAIDTGVAVRMSLWAAISIVMFLSVAEAYADRRFAREARP